MRIRDLLQKHKNKKSFVAVNYEVSASGEQFIVHNGKIFA